MFADLHLHTTFSDGTLSPSEMVKKAASRGIGLISVCDHNTVDAYSWLASTCSENGMRLLTGVEIDCIMGSRHIHLLGYGFDLNDPALLALLEECRQKRQYHNDTVIVNMARDYPIDLDEYAAHVTPPEIVGYKNADFLLRKGIINAIAEYFPLHKKYRLKIETIGLPRLERACSAIKSAGGTPVLAHPWRVLDHENFDNELQAAVDSGVVGLECYYPDHDEKTAKLCVDFCNERDLLITAGSDDHGDFIKEIDGIVYQLGEIMAETRSLNLRGLAY